MTLFELACRAYDIVCVTCFINKKDAFLDNAHVHVHFWVAAHHMQRTRFEPTATISQAGASEAEKQGRQGKAKTHSHTQLTQCIGVPCGNVMCIWMNIFNVCAHQPFFFTRHTPNSLTWFMHVDSKGHETEHSSKLCWFWARIAPSHREATFQNQQNPSEPVYLLAMYMRNMLLRWFLWL